MHFSKHTADIEARLGLRRFFVFALALSLATNALLAMALVAKDDNHRQTIVPAVITKEFWVDDYNVSAEYLEQMAYFALNYILNNTPQNVDYNISAVLKLVSPRSYGEIERSLRSSAQRLKANNATTAFHVMSAQTDAASKTVVFNGLLATFIGDRRTSQVAKAYLVRFAYAGGKTFITELRETSVKDPFKDPGPPVDAADAAPAAPVAAKE
jgi:conjugal transfer pilus assembly protein TraE